jgi:hypothetical protein
VVAPQTATPLDGSVTAVPSASTLSNPSEYEIHYPFPQAGKLKVNGLSVTNYTQEQMNEHCNQAYDEWVRAWVTDANCPPGTSRVQNGTGPYNVLFYMEDSGTLSEQIGWGMLLSVYMENNINRTKALFDRLNRYRKYYRNEQGLMMSTIKYNHPMDKYSTDAATEADENMAMALLLADAQWGSTGETDYRTEAMNLLTAIRTYLVDPTSFVLKPAVNWGGNNLMDPCYYDPMYYRYWARITGDQTWTQLDENYQWLVAHYQTSYQSGLLPEWCTASGEPAMKDGIDQNFMMWDAHQVPIKLAWHYLWWGGDDTDFYRRASNRIAAWITQKTGGQLETISSKYTLDGDAVDVDVNGTVTPLLGVPYSVAAISASGIASSDHQQLVNDAYEYLLSHDLGVEQWMFAEMRVFLLLMYSGNWVFFAA